MSCYRPLPSLSLSTSLYGLSPSRPRRDYTVSCRSARVPSSDTIVCHVIMDSWLCTIHHHASSSLVRPLGELWRDPVLTQIPHKSKKEKKEEKRQTHLANDPGNTHGNKKKKGKEGSPTSPTNPTSPTTPADVAVAEKPGA